MRNKLKSGRIGIDVLNTQDNIPKINGNITQLQEVFFNLIDNAYDAIQERMQNFMEVDYRGTIQVSALELDDGYLRIDFEDNGIGVRKENREKLFTPFFTTKVSSRKGTGLGLYVINKIITQNHDGRIRVESEYLKGTKFILELPIAK